MTRVGQLLVGKYRIDALIKNVGRAEIYQGTQLPLQKKVLVEIFPLEIGESLKLEDFFALTKLSHPNLLDLIDYGETEGESFLVFEMPEGETLKETIKRKGILSLEESCRIINQIASVLQTAHLNNIVHGRLSSENIFVCPLDERENLIKVFGFASYSYSESPSVEEAQYLAPEQFSNFRLKDERCDIYALGIVAYEMLTGQVPFSSTSLEDLHSKHLKDLPRPISDFRNDVSEELEAVVRRALAKNPDSRFQSVKGFAESFDFAVVGSLPKKDAFQIKSEQEFQSSSNLWKTAFITLAGILLLGGFFIYLTWTKQIEPPTKLPTDADATPVQPIGPATGAEERVLSNMKDFGTLSLSNSKINPEVVRQSKGSNANPWATGSFVPPTGQFYDGNVNPNSPFMAPDGNIYVLVPKNSNVSANSNVQKPKSLPSNSNSQQTDNLKTENPKLDSTKQKTQELQNLPNSTPRPNQSPTPASSNKKP
ncbi:MAG: serine/threonine protein kinase [Acidobacteria bacterium]|jgi:serine/threonine-protein kinase|nr:MAG: serine/threonine protein kinase [Acidobacteriota bacterium]GIU82609.1 MAG: hypothetical protein KatS3mg006_1673 [Pyrinomonadaceae bacterium]